MSDILSGDIIKAGFFIVLSMLVIVGFSLVPSIFFFTEEREARLFLIDLEKTLTLFNGNSQISIERSENIVDINFQPDRITVLLDSGQIVEHRLLRNMNFNAFSFDPQSNQILIS